jgi:hypothetical protein
LEISSRTPHQAEEELPLNEASLESLTAALNKYELNSSSSTSSRLMSGEEDSKHSSKSLNEVGENTREKKRINFLRHRCTKDEKKVLQA